MINFAYCVTCLISDFDDIELPSPITVPEIPSNSAFHVNAEDGLVTLTEQHFAELQRTIQSLASQVTNTMS